MERLFLSYLSSYQDMDQEKVVWRETELSYEQIRGLLKYFGLDGQAGLVILRSIGKMQNG